MATHMLNKARIQALIRATTKTLTDTILAEIGYIGTQHPVEQIIETARHDAVGMFMKNCADPAVCTCVKAIYDFSITPTAPGAPLRIAEAKLCDTIARNMKAIKSASIKNYYQTLLDAWTNDKKMPTQALWERAYEMRLDTEGAGFVFYWYCLKQLEFIAVKTILLGKQFGFGAEKIMDDLRGIYDRF
jgi:hypothetical protein